ncbi:MAG TPA: outer membrane protein assembly factor BamA, partial [Epsilonproteobacteria bacterium]|nr:outer membrane protein assembly factor BamA [Campylobacterota bacterium]
YNPYSISPTEGGSRVGGTQSFSNTIEASIPLSEATKMRLAFFLDYGVIGSDPILTTNGKVTPGNVARSSGGAVIEWQSPFGPINLIFADAINPKDGDYTSFFEFSMGTKF